MQTKTIRIKPDPDFKRLEMVLRREGTPDRVPFYELFSDIQREALEALGKLSGNVCRNQSGSGQIDPLLKQHISYMFNLGYDYVNVGVWWEFPRKENPKAMTDEGERSYLQGNTCTISNREEFEKYGWPDISRLDYSQLETIGNLLPEGMRGISVCSGILENVMWLLGYEGISYLLYDDEQLVRDAFEAVGTRIIKYLDTCASFDVVGAVALGEDMGFKTQTMLSPEIFREYLFPWHKKLVDAVHQHNKPIILHSCGNLTEVMQDIIDCGWDAKHSFEDVIEPVWEAKEKYGDRIALLGGFDMDKISRMGEEEVRSHTRFLIEKCATGGGWALGTGNSVANYIPVNNFLAMLEEGFLKGWY